VQCALYGHSNYCLLFKVSESEVDVHKWPLHFSPLVSTSMGFIAMYDGSSNIHRTYFVKKKKY
jgi:hypothetical protein